MERNDCSFLFCIVFDQNVKSSLSTIVSEFSVLNAKFKSLICTLVSNSNILTPLTFKLHLLYFLKKKFTFIDLCIKYFVMISPISLISTRFVALLYRASFFFQVAYSAPENV